MKTAVIIVVALLIIGGIFLFVIPSSNDSESNLLPIKEGGEVPRGTSDDNVQEEPGDTPPTNEPTDLPIVNYIVEYTSSGFEPSTITIKQGDSITFKNTITRETWPASAMHPTHKSYPGSDISKCPSTEIFDACKGLETGEEYTFTFDELGSWGYHNHLRSSEWGTIIVQ